MYSHLVCNRLLAALLFCRFHCCIILFSEYMGFIVSDMFQILQYRPRYTPSSPAPLIYICPKYSADLWLCVIGHTSQFLSIATVGISFLNVKIVIVTLRWYANFASQYGPRKRLHLCSYVLVVVSLYSCGQNMLLL